MAYGARRFPPLHSKGKPDEKEGFFQGVAVGSPRRMNTEGAPAGGAVGCGRGECQGVAAQLPRARSEAKGTTSCLPSVPHLQ